MKIFVKRNLDLGYVYLLPINFYMLPFFSPARWRRQYAQTLLKIKLEIIRTLQKQALTVAKETKIKKKQANNSEIKQTIC